MRAFKVGVTCLAMGAMLMLCGVATRQIWFLHIAVACICVGVGSLLVALWRDA